MLTEGFTKKFVMIGSGLKPNEFKGIKPVGPKANHSSFDDDQLM